MDKNQKVEKISKKIRLVSRDGKNSKITSIRRNKEDKQTWSIERRQRIFKTNLLGQDGEIWENVTVKKKQKKN